MSAEAVLRRRQRGTVISALRDAAVEGSFGVDDNANISAVLMSHLSGAPISAELLALCDEAHTTIRRAVGREACSSVEDAVPWARLKPLLRESAFVRALQAKGWDHESIAGEILTLTFAGWASLSAVMQTAATLGVGGRRRTEADVVELLRLAPPGWLITREAVEPMLLSGRSVAPGTLLIASPWLLHRDPAVWDKPDEFDSDRVGTDRSASYLPFGLGAWGCPAERYSRAVLLELLKRRPDVSRSSSDGVPSLIDHRAACLVNK